MAARNPFAPTFGASPPVLAGRDAILLGFEEALETGPTHPDYTLLLVGVRGAGKTVMLNALEERARTLGWLALSLDATSSGLIDRLTAGCRSLVLDMRAPRPKRRLRGVKVAGVGSIDVEPVPPPEADGDLRSLLSEIGDRLAEQETGLLITIDELQAGVLDEIREFGAVLQHVARREQRPIAFAAAALPVIVETLLGDEGATFLQRCARYDIDTIDDRAVSEAIAGAIRGRGGSISNAALARAVAATSGYAFMVQLVGFYAWRAARDPSQGIGIRETERGITEAESRIGQLVIAPTWTGLSGVDRRFLVAMAMDDGPSRLRDVANRLDADIGYAGVYRNRLIRSGLVAAAGRGRVRFTHPATRDWIRREGNALPS